MKWNRTRTLSWSLLVGVALSFLHGPAAIRLPSPPGWSPAVLHRWVVERGLVEVSATMLRWAAIGLGWYLVVTTVVAVAVRLSGREVWIRYTDLVCIAAVRRAACVFAGAGLSVSALAMPVGAQQLQHQIRTAPVLDQAVFAAGPALRVASTPVLRVHGTSPQLRFVDVEPISTASASPEAHAAPLPALVGPTARSAETSTWTVSPGDHLWSIAEAVLVQKLGSAPDEKAVANYWLQILDANRARLADPSNPDLLVVGQVINLPFA